MIDPRWVTAFLDFPASSYDDGVAFWCGVTGYELSPPRGSRREFATLVPPDGDAFLRVQRVLDGPGGIHLDLHVEDPRAAADAAASLGATEVTDLGHVIMRSPGGLTFCTVPSEPASRPAPTELADGTRSIVDQVCIDVPASAYDGECAFWADLTGWQLGRSTYHHEFSYLVRPEGMPLRFLIQRLDESSGPARAHLDLACEDRPAEVLRHARLGAQLLTERDHWTTLRGPTGAPHCVTDRDPKTGLLV